MINAQKNLRTIGVLLAPFVFLFGFLYHSFNMMFIACFIVFICNIIFSLERAKERVAFLCFNGTFFLFLMGRPIISMLRSEEWWNVGNSKQAVLFAVFSIFVSLLSLYVGAIFQDNKQKKISSAVYNNRNSAFIKNLELISFIIFIFAVFCTFLEGIERVIFMQTHTYLDMYTGAYQTQMPAIVKGFIQIMKPSLCVFLVTMPQKQKANLVLFLYFVSTLPSLRVGMRSPTMLACVFIVIYYVMRDAMKKPTEPRWFGKLEKTAFICMVPFVIVFLLVYTELRNGQNNVAVKIQNPLSNFIYEQGISFHVLSQFWDQNHNIPDVGFPGYFFGYIYDCIRNNMLIRELFNLPLLIGQTVERLELSYDLKAHLSYAVFRERYFQGHGVGTSYILDVFQDFKWIGLVFFNIFIARYLINFKRLISKHWLIGVIVLYSFLTLFYIPRSTPTEPFSFLFLPYFWVGVGVCYIGALLITPRTHQNETKYIGILKSKYIKE